MRDDAFLKGGRTSRPFAAGVAGIALLCVVTRFQGPTPERGPKASRRIAASHIDSRRFNYSPPNLAKRQLHSGHTGGRDYGSKVPPPLGPKIG